MKFVVIIPTWNRADTLPRALDSLIAQTHQNWFCYILDDGSTDGTYEMLSNGYYRHDPRFFLLPHERPTVNQGGVAMNEIGMDLAIRDGDAWVRLGSDDWFEPEKLELDAIALGQGYGACFGPYQNSPEDYTITLNGPSRPRDSLLKGSMAASWANIAVRTSVLEQVRERHGMFCDPRLRNMEDWLANSRIARFSEIVWRSLSKDRASVAVGATKASDLPFEYVPDAHYRIAAESASYGSTAGRYAAADTVMTERILGEDRAKGFAVKDIPSPTLSIVPRRVSP